MEHNRPHHEFHPEIPEATELSAVGYTPELADLEDYADVTAEGVMAVNPADAEPVDPPEELASPSPPDYGEQAEFALEPTEDPVDTPPEAAAGTPPTTLPPTDGRETTGEGNQNLPEFDLERFDDEPLPATDEERQEVNDMYRSLARHLQDTYAEYAFTEIDDDLGAPSTRVVLEREVADGRVHIHGLSYAYDPQDPNLTYEVIEVRHSGQDGSILSHTFRNLLEETTIRRETVDMLAMTDPDALESGTVAPNNLRAVMDANFEKQEEWLDYQAEVGLNRLPVGPLQMRHIVEVAVGAEPQIVTGSDIYQEVQMTVIPSEEVPVKPVTPADAVAFTEFVRDQVLHSSGRLINHDHSSNTRVILEPKWITTPQGAEVPLIETRLTGPATASWVPEEFLEAYPDLGRVEVTMTYMVRDGDLVCRLIEELFDADSNSIDDIASEWLPASTDALYQLRLAMRKPVAHRELPHEDVA